VSWPVICLCSARSSKYQLVADDVAEHVGSHAKAQGVADEPGWLRMQGGLAADEADDPGAERRGLGEDRLPRVGRHGAVRSVRPGPGVAVDAGRAGIGR
jgi:hypothetical protein